jgi:hypothetical protein
MAGKSWHDAVRSPGSRPCAESIVVSAVPAESPRRDLPGGELVHEDIAADG